MPTKNAVYRVKSSHNDLYYLAEGTSRTPVLIDAAEYSTHKAAQTRARKLPICHFWTIEKGAHFESNEIETD